MDRLFKPNAIIDETAMTTKRRKFFSIGLVFLLVYFISNFISGFISTIPMYYLIFSDDTFMSTVMDSAVSSDFDIYMDEYNKAIEEAINSIFVENASLITLFSLFATVGTIIVVLFYCIKIEKRRLFTLGFVKKGFITEYLSGIVIGALMFSAVYGIMLLSGEVKFDGFNLNLSIGTLLLYLLGFIIQGASEEILLRSYFFVSCSANTNVFVSILASSALFSALHLGNPGFNLLAFVNLFLFGVFAALYFLRRGSIWGICAIHTVWNFAQGNIFGCSVSGMPLDNSVFLTSKTQGIIWSGGEFGPEAGIAVTLIFIIGIAILTFMKNKEIDGFFIRTKGEFVSDYLFN